MGRIIYQHIYSHMDIDKIEEAPEETSFDNNYRLSYEELEKKHLNNTQLLLDNTRIYGKQDFIKAAISLSEWYELDILVTECKSHISVELIVDQYVNMKLFKPLFLLADELTIVCGKNDGKITLYLDYYTHVVIRNGTVISP